MGPGPEATPKFEMLTRSEAIGFRVGAVCGAGAGLIIYSSTPSPSASADQKIEGWRGQVHDTEAGLASSSGYPIKEQRSADAILLQHLSSAENHLDASISHRPTSPDRTAGEAGTVIEGMVAMGLIFAALVTTVRGLRHARHAKKARAFEKEVSASLSQLPVDTSQDRPAR
jgi:hypothetical protein